MNPVLASLLSKIIHRIVSHSSYVLRTSLFPWHTPSVAFQPHLFLLSLQLFVLHPTHSKCIGFKFVFWILWCLWYTMNTKPSRIRTIPVALTSYQRWLKIWQMSTKLSSLLLNHIKLPVLLPPGKISMHNLSTHNIQLLTYTCNYQVQRGDIP